MASLRPQHPQLARPCSRAHPSRTAPVPGGLQRPAQALLAQPQPGGPRRAAPGEPVEERRDDAGDRLVGVPAYFPVALAPDQPDRQAATQFPTGGLVTDPALNRARSTWSSASLMIPT